MEETCRQTAEHLRFRAPHISHAVTVLILGLAFYSEEPYVMGDTINVFLFPNMLPLAGSEAALLARRWYTILVGGALTSFTDTSFLLTK